jgi:hypothetical protein
MNLSNNLEIEKERDLDLNMEISCYYFHYSLETQTLILEYLKQLDNIQKKAYKIAKEHLGSSFYIINSNGYKEWLKNNKYKKT